RRHTRSTRDWSSDVCSSDLVATRSPALSAELEGSRLPLADVPEAEESDRERLPDAVRRAAERIRADRAALFPVRVDGAVRGTLRSEERRVGGEGGHRGAGRG